MLRASEKQTKTAWLGFDEHLALGLWEHVFFSETATPLPTSLGQDEVLGSTGSHNFLKNDPDFFF